MGAGDNTLDLNVGTVGAIDMGDGTNNIVNLNIGLELSKISSAGTVTVSCAGQTLTVSGSFGAVGATNNVSATTLTFNSGTVLSGTLNTSLSGNVLNASGTADGGTLIDATAINSWDVIDNGQQDMHFVGNSGFDSGDQVTLVDGGTHAIDLDNWDTAGVTEIKLDLGGSTYNMTWNNDHYEVTVGTETWQFTDASNTKLTLGIA